MQGTVPYKSVQHISEQGLKDCIFSSSLKCILWFAKLFSVGFSCPKQLRNQCENCTFS